MTGLSVDTIRAWERRHKVVQPTRSGGARSYSQSDVDRFRRLRRALGNGFSIRQAALLDENALTDLISTGTEAPPAIPLDSSLAKAVDQLDAGSLESHLGKLAALLSPLDLLNEVLLPLMRHAEGLRPIHRSFVMEASRKTLLALIRLHDARGPKVLIAGDSLMAYGVAALACSRGLAPLLLGGDLPASEVLFAVRQVTPVAVLAEGDLAAIRAGLGPGIELRGLGSGSDDFTACDSWLAGLQEAQCAHS